MNNGNGWVSVTERTPKKDGTYLVTLSSELVGQNEPFTSIELFEGGEWEEDGDRMDEYARTIHKETERNAQKARQREQLKDGSRSVGEYKPVRNGMREKGRKGDNMEYKDLYLTDRR